MIPTFFCPHIADQIVPSLLLSTSRCCDHRRRSSKIEFADLIDMLLGSIGRKNKGKSYVQQT